MFSHICAYIKVNWVIKDKYIKKFRGRKVKGKVTSPPWGQSAGLFAVFGYLVSRKRDISKFVFRGQSNQLVGHWWLTLEYQELGFLIIKSWPGVETGQVVSSEWETLARLGEHSNLETIARWNNSKKPHHSSIGFWTSLNHLIVSIYIFACIERAYTVSTELGLADLSHVFKNISINPRLWPKMRLDVKVRQWPSWPIHLSRMH